MNTQKQKLRFLVTLSVEPLVVKGPGEAAIYIYVQQQQQQQQHGNIPRRKQLN